jgi:hypothetical protein
LRLGNFRELVLLFGLFDFALCDFRERVLVFARRIFDTLCGCGDSPHRNGCSTEVVARPKWLLSRSGCSIELN